LLPSAAILAVATMPDSSAPPACRTATTQVAARLPCPSCCRQQPSQAAQPTPHHCPVPPPAPSPALSPLSSV
jgi:hypothetical protein